MIDEGYVKYTCHWQVGDAPKGIDELVAIRNELVSMGLVGEYVDIGIGYGNVSQRIGTSDLFVVSGTATGNIRKATAAHFSEVTAWSLENNIVDCIGPVAASSESMTHGMLYACDPKIKAVLHVHHRAFWENLLQTHPSTRKDVAYGTPAMAIEMQRLLRTPTIWRNPIIPMQGHEEGIVAFGSNLQSTMAEIVKKYKKWGERVEKPGELT